MAGNPNRPIKQFTRRLKPGEVRSGLNPIPPAMPSQSVATTNTIVGLDATPPLPIAQSSYKLHPSPYPPIRRDHRYPGLGLPLRYNPREKCYPLGAHSSCAGALSDIIYVRELAMMSVMEKLTDKPDWHKKVFDDEIVERWRKEAQSIPDLEIWNLAIGGKNQRHRPNDGELEVSNDDSYDIKIPEGILSEMSFHCCIDELRSKAKYFEKTGIVLTLDASASIAKSDGLVSEDLHDSLRNAFVVLRGTSTPEWHPNTNERVQDLVHPSMYPLVYGRTPAFQEECVGVKDAIDHWAGKGIIIPKDAWERDEERDRYNYGIGEDSVPPHHWSTTYQWLPANVMFQDDGCVQFTSYINNLHPIKHQDIYHTIERLIETSLPLWDQCLAMKPSNDKSLGAGRTEPRMGKPDDPDDDNLEHWIPNTHQACADAYVSNEQLQEEGIDPNDTCPEELAEYKWRVLRKPCLPEPIYTSIDYAPQAGARLAHLFCVRGLQIIVKLASIELTPDKPNFPAGGWHVEGQMNEHICGTALYYVDSENVTPSNLSFRMQTSNDINDDDYMVGQGNYHWLESAHGSAFGAGNSACLQNYGSVETPQGRLLAFPNVFQHRVSPFKLVDPSKPGHRRFIALWLVDPTIRVISTANVPPQQADWYTDSLFRSSTTSNTHASSKIPTEIRTLLHEKGLAPDLGENAVTTGEAKLPAELLDIARQYLDASEDGTALPMTVEEARGHRLKLMAERSVIQVAAETSWQQCTYNFCEH